MFLTSTFLVSKKDKWVSGGGDRGGGWVQHLSSSACGSKAIGVRSETYIDIDVCLVSVLLSFYQFGSDRGASRSQF